VKITSLTIDGSRLRTQVQADGGSAKRNADVYVAIALDHAETHVLHGENSGRHLTHVAVLQQLNKIGKLEPGKHFAQDVQFKLNAPGDPANLRIIAFVQEPGPGKILGATREKLSSAVGHS
jgi:hypothetical protein